jgi:hypothetical protein
MSINKEDITQNAKKYFDDFINKLIKDRKYFYWEVDYFKRIDNIFFQYYELSTDEKKDINDIGKTIIDEDNIIFSIVNNSIRNELEIKNLSTHIPHYYHHVMYIKEFILLTIMQNNFEKFKQYIELQEKNFIYTYLKYMIDKNIPFNHPDFVSFSQLRQHEELMNSLDIQTKNEEIEKEREILKQRLAALKINNNFKNKITFLFKLPNFEEKEELRFALSELSGKELFFRGQANSNWSLNPSIARSQNLLDNEHQLFQKILALKPNDFTNDKTDYEKLITMQHYGLPTRLLDLTRNPLVAIFFACNNWSRNKEDGLVYIFENKEKDFLNPDDEKVEKLTQLMKLDFSAIRSNEEFEKDMYKENHFIRGVAKNQRINNQSGDFIFVGIGNDTKENKTVEELVSRYLIIDYKVKPILLENLEVMNIHGGSVYPELGNMSSYLVNKYQ